MFNFQWLIRHEKFRSTTEIILALTFVGLVIFPFSPFSDTHWPKWWMFHLATAVAIGAYFIKYHWSVGLTIATSLISGAQAFANRDFYFRQGDQVKAVLGFDSAKASLTLLALAFLADKLSAVQVERLLKAFIVFAIGHCLYVFYQLHYLGLNTWTGRGFLPNTSMAPSMLVMLLPLVIGYGKRLVYPRAITALFVLTMIEHRSSIAFAALLTTSVFAGFIWLHRRWHLRATILTVLGALLVLLPLGVLFDPEWSHLWVNERFKFWPAYVEFWVKQKQYLMGMGLGTFRYFGPEIQIAKNLDVGYFMPWAHSDVLQMMFEVGLIGLISAATMIVISVKKALMSKRLDLASALVAMVVIMCGNYPLHLAEFATLVTLLLTTSFKISMSGGRCEQKETFSNGHSTHLKSSQP